MYIYSGKQYESILKCCVGCLCFGLFLWRIPYKNNFRLQFRSTIKQKKKLKRTVSKITPIHLWTDKHPKTKQPLPVYQKLLKDLPCVVGTLRNCLISRPWKDEGKNPRSGLSLINESVRFREKKWISWNWMRQGPKFRK